MKLKQVTAALVLVVNGSVAQGQVRPPAAPRPSASTVLRAPNRPANPQTDCGLDARDHVVVQSTYNELEGAIVFYTEYHVTCEYSGHPNFLQVQPGLELSALEVAVAGAAGGDSPIGACCNSNGTLKPGGHGKGAVVNTRISVSSGAKLLVFVGGQGVGVFDGSGGGFNGGGAADAEKSRGNAIDIGSGGGGASDIRAAPYGVEDRLVVAGGGGGASSVGAGREPACSGDGGDGGFNGHNGHSGCPHSEDGSRNINLSTGGRGGNQTGGGAGGNQDPYFNGSSAGLAGAGPSGGTAKAGGGGGGGGWFGGGSGGSVAGGGGGGGSSRTGAEDPNPQVVDGARDGNGQVVVTYRVFTRRVRCFNISPKAQIRDYPKQLCSGVSVY